MISNEDGSEIIIVGYAENSGVERHNYIVEEGTTIGVYWAVILDDEGYYHISRAKVVGYKDNSSWKKYFRRYRRSDFRFSHRWMWTLRMFFAGWYDKYLVMAEDVELGENPGEYSIYGTDEEGEDALAIVTARKVLSIEKYEAPGPGDNQPPAAGFPEGDYEVTDAGTTLVNGVYEETGTFNSHPLYTRIGGGYKIFFAYFSGHSFPPPTGDFWCIDTDENTSSLLDLEYWKYGTVALPPLSGWSAQTGTAPAPVLSQIEAFSGSTGLYGTLTIVYTFSDPDGDAEGATLFRWFRYDPAVNDDPGTLIPGAEGVSYTTTDDDNGMYLKVEVTPVDDRNLAGLPVLSGASGVIGY